MGRFIDPIIMNTAVIFSAKLMFVNEFFYPGYLSKDRIEGILNQ